MEVTAPVGLHVEFGAVEIHDDGSASVFAGTSVHGQGHHTAFAMLASEVLGIPMDKITLVNSDTDRVPRGAGTMGSRSLQTAGSAIHVAVERGARPGPQASPRTCSRRPPDDIVVGDGGLHVAGVPAQGAVVGRAGRRRRVTHPGCPTDSKPAPLRHELDFDGTDSTFPFGAHVSVVEVDTETGRSRCCATSRSTTAGASSTRCSSPASSTAASPRARRRRCTSGCSTTPTATRSRRTSPTTPCRRRPSCCSFEVSNTQTDSPRNPLGAKGIGESGTIGSTPAIHNAVVDAVSHLGVTHIDMPCTAERVWRAIQAASK